MDHLWSIVKVPSQTCRFANFKTTRKSTLSNLPGIVSCEVLTALLTQVGYTETTPIDTTRS